jgi:hypothetical protein
MNEPVALALLAAFPNGEYRTAGAVAFFMPVTITLERKTAIGAEAAIEAVVRLTPRVARWIVNGQEEQVDAFGEMQVGDICRVRPGETLPADGVMVTGPAAQISNASHRLPLFAVLPERQPSTAQYHRLQPGATLRREGQRSEGCGCRWAGARGWRRRPAACRPPLEARASRIR